MMQRLERIPLPVGGATANLSPALGGWLLTTSGGCVLCREGAVVPVDVDATPKDESIRPMPIAVSDDGRVFIASESAVFQVNEDGSTATVVSLAALSTSRMPSLLAIRGDGFVVGVSGTGGETTSWLHEVDSGGQKVGTVELHSNRGHNLTGISTGDALLVEAGALFRVDAMGAPEEIEGAAPLAVLGPHHALTRGGWDPQTRRAQSFLCRFEHDNQVARVEIPGQTSPNLIALGNGWESWTQGSKLFVHRDGDITKLRAGGWVTALASNGEQLASAALSASKPALLVWG